MNPDEIYNHPQWWTLERDGVTYTFRETSGHCKDTAGKIRVESSHGKTEVYGRSNARSFWNSLVECGYVLREQGEATHIHIPRRRSERRAYETTKQSYSEIYDELVNAVEAKIDDINSNYALEA